MIVKTQIGALVYRDDPREITTEHGLCIVAAENGLHGIYDYQAGRSVVPPEYDNIYEVDASLYAFSSGGRLALWTLVARRNSTDGGFETRFAITQRTGFELDRIELDSGIPILHTYGRNGGRKRIYHLESDWLSKEYDWVAAATDGLIMARGQGEELLMTPAGEILWRDEAPQMLLSTGCDLGGDPRYPLFFNTVRQRHLFPVFREGWDDEMPGGRVIWKYVLSRNPPRWCRAEGIYCPAHSGCYEPAEILPEADGC